MDPDRLMRNMMQSMGMGMGMGMPMSNIFDDFGTFSPMTSQGRRDSLMPAGFMPPMSMMMMNPFQGMHQAMSMANPGMGNGFSYCSSSVTSYTTDEHGRPQVYQQSNEVKQGPDGLKETKSAIRDSRTGHQEMAIGHHLHNKAHIKKKSKNLRTGEEEQADVYENLEEEEAESFEQTWQRQARSASNNTHNQIQYDPYGRPTTGRPNRLALTCSADSRHGHASSSNHTDKAAMKTKKKKKSKEEKHR